MDKFFLVQILDSKGLGMKGETWQKVEENKNVEE